jgi:hypothetical protein
MTVNKLTLADRIFAGVIPAASIGSLVLLPRPPGFPAESMDILEYELWSAGAITISHQNSGGAVFAADEHVVLKLRFVTGSAGGDPIAAFFITCASDVNVLVHARQSSYADK